ncbi:MAG: ATP-dependent helicase, partial [Planktothrix sp.]
MKILHGTWIPETTGDFIEQGAFYLWVETSTRKTKRNSDRLHPQHLTASNLEAFVRDELGISEPDSRLISLKYFTLPTVNQQPLPSPELAKYLETDLSLDFEEFATWEITTYQLTSSQNRFNSLNIIIKILKEIHFFAQQNPSEMSLGSDLFFWYHYTQLFKQILYKDQYIPALKYRQLASPKTKGKGKRSTQTPVFEIYSGWEIISEQYQSLITQSINSMP